MSGPAGFIPRNIAAEVNAALEEGAGWDYFHKQILPLAQADTFRPDDALLKTLAHFSSTLDGMKILQWLHDLTDLAPYPIGMATLEEAAMAAARHGGRASVGHVLSKAVREGRRLIDQQQT